MATVQEARSWGFATPEDSDLIKDGDDAITQNAIAATDLRVQRGRMPANSNLLELAHGVHTIANVTDAGTIQGLPEVWPGVIDVIGNHEYITSPLRTIYFYPHARDYHYVATLSSFTALGRWRKMTEHSEPPAPGTSAGGGLANSVLMDEFTGAMGGRIDTGGLGAIAVRIDHGLDKFNALIRPLLEARNIPYCLAISSRRWDVAENTGVTPAMVNTWVQGGLCEIWNHGATAHDNVSGLSAIQDYWVNGKTELESQIPSAKIYGAILPGTGTPNAFDGLAGASTPQQIFGSTGGQVILGSHAVVSGAFSGTTLRVLDGTPRQGQAHIGIDSRSYAEVTGYINQARDQQRGLQLMLHPSRVNLTDMNTAAQIEAMLDYIVSERDAGRIKVLSPYQLMLADATI